MTRRQSRYPMDSGPNVFGEDGAPQAGPARSAIAASRGEFRPVPRWLRLAQEPPVSR
jgi:hypothetical protein